MAERPTIGELVVADAPESWRELGFAIDGDRLVAGSVRVRLAGPDAGSGLVHWSLRGFDGTDLDGLPTSACAELRPADPGRHPNGCLQIDHVVVFTPDLERTTAVLETAGIERRRVREARPVRQGFFRLGEVILEVVDGVPDGPAPGAPAEFWGLVFVVEDIDACKELLGERLGEVRDAVQPGRRIVTVRRDAGLGLPVALITPAA